MFSMFFPMIQMEVNPQAGLTYGIQTQMEVNPQAGLTYK